MIIFLRGGINGLATSAFIAWFIRGGYGRYKLITPDARGCLIISVWKSKRKIPESDWPVCIFITKENR